jgi:hypothetical protein
MKWNNIKRNLFLMIPAGGLIMTGLFSCARPLYDSDHKFRKDVTLKELQGVEVTHGPLIGVSYSHGGGMQGDTNLIELYRDSDGRAMIKTTSAAEHSFSLIEKEYTADEQLFDALRERIDRNNLSVWEDLPFDEEHIALDGPSTSIGMYFDDSETGGYRREYCRISYDNVIPEGRYDILNEFAETLCSGIHEENLLSSGFVYDGSRIVTGRDTDNTDAEISALVSGYWACKDSGTEYLSYNYGLYDTVDVDVINDPDRSEMNFTVAETVHEPYEDADTGWHVLMRDEQDEEWAMYTEGMQLVLRRTDDSVCLRFDRRG